MLLTMLLPSHVYRDASVRIADLPLGETNVIEAEATERRLRFARDLTTSARSQSKEVVAQQSTNAEAALTNTSCQWVQDTDVLNK